MSAGGFAQKTLSWRPKDGLGTRGLAPRADAAAGTAAAELESLPVESGAGRGGAAEASSGGGVQVFLPVGRCV